MQEIEKSTDKFSGNFLFCNLKIKVSPAKSGRLYFVSSLDLEEID